MQVSELMTSAVETISPLATLEAAAMAMQRHDIGMLPVVEDGQLRGVVTDRDICIRGVAENRDGMFARVSDVMSKQIYNCLADHDIEDAAELMIGLRVRRLVVLDGSGALAGIVSLADLARKAENAAGFVLGKVSAPPLAKVAARAKENA